ncbi:VWA domain-containing protein [soil metagenome]
MSNSSLPVITAQNSVTPITSAGNILDARKVALSPLYYNARVTSSNPCAIILLLDHSGSMKESIIDNRGEKREKASTLANYVNKFLDEIILTCQKTDLIKDYFQVLIISYGKYDEDGVSSVSVAWQEKLKDKTWVTVNELRNSALRKDIITVPNPKPFGAKFLKEEQNIWIEPCADGLTPMKQAFETCNTFVEDWVNDNSNSFPPLIFNITDGEASDVNDFAELVESAEKIKSNNTVNGNALLFNLLLLANNEDVKEFPLFSERNLFENNEYEMALFDASSTIPENLKNVLPVKRDAHEEVKALVLGNLETILSFLNIGTSTLRNNIK